MQEIYIRVCKDVIYPIINYLQKLFTVTCNIWRPISSDTDQFIP